MQLRYIPVDADQFDDPMLMYAAVMTAALIVAALTLFSGFGIGMLLMPVFALFFPVESAIIMTAVVHLSNNLFKVAIMGKYADWGIAWRFVLPGLVTSALGAYLLTRISVSAPLWTYELSGTREITIVKIVVATLMILFALIELTPAKEKYKFSKRYIPLGGALSGFFGGLSGHQGALRSAFLLRSIGDKTRFIGTGVVCAVVVDFARLTVYGTSISAGTLTIVSGPGEINLIIAATLTAFVGSFVGSRLMKKVKMIHVRNIVGGMLLLLALLLGAGII